MRKFAIASLLMLMQSQFLQLFDKLADKGAPEGGLERDLQSFLDQLTDMVLFASRVTQPQVIDLTL